MMDVENPVIEEECLPPASDACIEGQDDDSDDDKEEAVFIGRKKKHNAVIDDSDEEDEQLSESKSLECGMCDEKGRESDEEEVSAQTEIGQGAKPKNGEQENESSPEPSPVGTFSSHQLLKNDLFDAEMDDSADEQTHTDDEIDDNSDSEKENVSNNIIENDAGSDEELVMSAALKRRLKQGAAKNHKSSASSRQERPKREDPKDLHSETQRLIRESRARLPYHKPQKADLSVFLARTKEKQQQLQSAKLGLAWKHMPELKAKLTPKDDSDVKSNKKQAVVDDPESVKKAVATCSIEDAKRNISKELDILETEDFDNLPDLVVEKETTNVHYEIITREEADLLATDGESKLIANQNITKQGESGYISLPTSEEENSGDQVKKASDEHIDVTLNKNCIMENEGDKQGDQSFSALDNTPNADSLSKRRTFLTPQLANLLVENVTPKLSGSPDTVISFEEEDSDQETPVSRIPTGIDKLMDRVIKHSAKRIPKKSEEIEITLITKESVNDRKELKMDKLVYHIDGDDTSPIKAPGAKLNYLKQKLQEQMKVKREEARQKRLQAFSLDNEEGFEEADEDKILDDEEEMSDHTDTEDEDDFDEDVDEEDVDEEELMDDREDKVAENENPFVDMEAEEDDADVEEETEDIDDDDEEGLHLELDVEDEEQTSQPLAQSSAHKTLHKAKTLELFDEDANTESPKMSQHSRNPAPEISSRPFQELSGSSTKTLIEDVMTVDDDILLLETQSIKSETTSMTRDVSLLSADSSFEGSLIPAGQRTHRKKQQNDRETPDLFMSSSKSSSLATVNKSISNMADMALPIEDSQDLLTQSMSTDIFPLSQPAPVDFHFQIEDTTQSQLLDENGLFKEKSDGKPARRQLILDSAMGGSTQNTDDELLRLCSGVFTEDSGASKKLFEADSASGSQGDMDELLSLCSGRFTGKNPDGDKMLSQKVNNGQCLGESDKNVEDELLSGAEDGNESPIKIDKKHHRVIRDDDSNDSFGLASAEEEQQQQYEDESLSSDDGDRKSEDEDQKNVDSDDKEMEQAKMFKGFTVANKHGKINPEFVEEEAELSGSEYDSDEDLDLPPEEDCLQLEEGDLDDVGTEEELRNQVGRVHLKTVIDDDKKQLKLFQEMYLPDGDLHSDGGGRYRRFRWRNIDDEDSQQDLFRSDDETEEGEEMQEEKEWRIKRFEREKYLEEMKNTKELEESSELIKLAKVIFKPKKDAKLATSEKAKEVKLVKPATAPPDIKENFIKPKLPSHGSFLRRSKGDLARIAKLAKPSSSSITGASHTGNFVFAALTPGEKQETTVPQVKRSNSTPTQPKNKRQKVERSNSIPENSIFRFM